MVAVQLLSVINWLEFYSSVRNVVCKRMSDDEAPISSVISLSGRMKRFCFSSHTCNQKAYRCTEDAERHGREIHQCQTDALESWY